MAGNQQFCLRWNNHQSTLISVFDNLLESGTLVDCTLAADGQYLKAHKVVLSACSPFFEGLFSQHYEKHPIIILKDVTFGELKAMLDYMYRGEVNISQEQLGAFLKAAESLQIKGLTDNSGNGELYHRKNDLRKVIMPPAAKSPCFPQGLIVEPRPGFINNNNNVDALPVHTRLDSSPKRRKRRMSDENDDSDAPSVPIPPPIVQVKEEAGTPPVNQTSKVPASTPIESNYKVEAKAEILTNNEDSGDEGVYPEDEDEEEMDLSKPGTSHAFNNHPPGAWNANSGENTSEENTPGGPPEQERMLLFRPIFGTQKGNGGRSEGSGGGGGGRGSASSAARSISCPTCQKCYSSQHTLRRHIRLECGKEPQFHCPYCPRKTKQRYNLMLHIARAHKPENIQPPW